MRTMPGAATDAGLGRFGNQTALVDGDITITYAELGERVEELCCQLGTRRRLLLVEAGNDVASVVALQAALRGGHPAMVVPPGGSALGHRLYERYDPDVVLASSGIVERRTGSRHRLHPDLALLLSTSGSTGSPRLVRLSSDNVHSNAAAIATYLGLDGDDVAQTSLPLHYCYGLSVLHSHLHVGATVVLSTASVVDPCFWSSVRDNEVTNFAGVPHTFELLDHAGFEQLDLPSLRFVTQAGGRLAPDSVRRYAELGRDRGWQLVVMYGQTEATARMAYLPPELAAEHPTSIGIPIPGGSFHLDDGELVYRGPNVMLGYAERSTDLALGRTVHELRTGDLARHTDEGLYEIVGRRSRFLKLFGLRIDLDGAERLLAETGTVATCAGDDAGVVVAVGVGTDVDAVRHSLASALTIPDTAIAVVAIDELPRLASGKVDLPAVLRMRPEGRTAAGTDVRAIYADLLHLPVGAIDDSDTFVGLGGDSLTYVEATVRLQTHLGLLPHDWHHTPIGDLTPRRRTARATLDTTVVLRALGILAVVVSHATDLNARGGAHLLLAVTGFNFARFQLAAVRASDRVQALWRSVARIAVPAVAIMALLHGDRLRIEGLLLVNGLTGAPVGGGQWNFWYLEVLVQVLALLGVLLLFRRVRAAERRRPLVFAWMVTALALLIRFDVLPLPDGAHPRFQVHNVLWLFALGWLAERSTTSRQRLAVSAVAAVALHGFFYGDETNLTVLAGFLLLAWCRHLPAPRLLHRPLATVASASLFIYLTHWQVLRHLHDAPALLGIATALVVGIAATALHGWRPRFSPARTASGSGRGGPWRSRGASPA